LWAVHHFQECHAAPGAKRAALDAIWSDFRKLKDASKREKWTDRTPVAPEFFGPMWPNGLPRNWPAVGIQRPVAVAKQIRRKPSIEELGLPPDLTAFLRAGSQLEFDHRQTEVGPIKLRPLAHLKFNEFKVTTKGTPLENKDPRRGDEGYYALRVVDLIGECDAHSPGGLLAWFCDYGVYGAWDPDHHTAITFPNLSWSKIVADPAKYLDAQWDPDPKVAKYIEPWKHCEFKED